ncbi:MAG: hypothetical protein JWN87_2987, partial [Frankiales bacterium]|nr:hypothetical protein [Frankiales bacterium]
GAGEREGQLAAVAPGAPGDGRKALLEEDADPHGRQATYLIW